VGEEELAGIDTKPLLGHLAAWNYFESIKNPVNTEIRQEVESLREGQTCRTPHGRDQRPDGSDLRRYPHVGAGGRESQVHRCRQGDRCTSR
jgi:hypothetical protein